MAADVPAAVPGLLEVLDQLDEEVAACGGRLYLAKDSRQSSAMFEANYKKSRHWNQFLDDKINLSFSSDLALRLNIKRIRN